MISGVWHTPEYLDARAQDPDYAIYDANGRNAYEYQIVPRREWMQRYLSEKGYNISGMLDSEKIPIIRSIFEDGRAEELMHIGQPDFKLEESNGCATYTQATDAMMQVLDFEVFTPVFSAADWKGDDGAHGLNLFCEVYADGTISPPIFVDSYWKIWGVYGDQMKEAGQTLGV